MKQFIILSVCLASAMSFKSYNMDHHHEAKEAESHDNCVDISYYDAVEYNVTTTQMCGYKKNTHCVPRKTQVCRNIPITECRIVGFTESEEWEECQDSVQPHCFDFQINIPHQEYNHLLRCTVEH